MFWKQLFGRKSLEMLHAEAEGDNRLRRVLGPIGLTSLGIGAIIGAGIFVMTGRVAANDAGPAVMLSFTVAGIGCALAAFCYSEFAAMAPVAGSAYTYAYATLGELFAWIIGWDLILEYAMSCATVASAWSQYFNKFTSLAFQWRVPEFLSYDPFSHTGSWFNLPAVLILMVVTVILVIGIRESAMSNTLLVVVKLGVVLFVIAMGVGYISKANWTSVPYEERKLAEESLIKRFTEEHVQDVEKLTGEKATERIKTLQAQALAFYKTTRTALVRQELTAKDALTPEVEGRLKAIDTEHSPNLPVTDADKEAVKQVLTNSHNEAPNHEAKSWGLLGWFGLNTKLEDVDKKTRTNFTPYGLSGIIVGASLVFFAFIGFDSISTHSEEAIKPQRDVPIGILASLCVCTVLYMAVAAVITGMQPYPTINTEAAIASAFEERAKMENSPVLKASAILIALGGLAGMTSVLLITFLSQARVFLAIARDGLMSPRIFGAIHPKFRTPHISTMLTGSIIMVVAALTPIEKLENMVNIGTLFAFVVVCAAVLLLRIRRPEVHRPFRCPIVFVVAPLGILVNVIMMLFLDAESWLRLVIWLAIGLCIYFGYGMRHSKLGLQARGLIPAFGGPAHAPGDSTGIKGGDTHLKG